MKIKTKLPVKNKGKGEAKDKEQKKFETMSTIGTSDTKSDIQKKLMEFTNVTNKEVQAVNTIAMGLIDTKNKKALQRANTLTSELQQQMLDLTKLIKNPQAKRDDQKKTLMSCFTLLNKAKAEKKDLKAAFPKKEKPEKKEAEEDPEEEEADEAEEAERVGEGRWLKPRRE